MCVHICICVYVYIHTHVESEHDVCSGEVRRRVVGAVYGSVGE